MGRGSAGIGPMLVSAQPQHSKDGPLVLQQLLRLVSAFLGKGEELGRGGIKPIWGWDPEVVSTTRFYVLPQAGQLTK